MSTLMTISKLMTISEFYVIYRSFEYITVQKILKLGTKKKPIVIDFFGKKL